MCWYQKPVLGIKTCTPCTLCKESKNIDSFPKSSGKDGRHVWCRTCLHKKYLSKRDKGRSEYITVQFYDFPEKIRKARKELKLTHREVADALGVTAQHAAR